MVTGMSIVLGQTRPDSPTPASRLVWIINFITIAVPGESLMIA